MSGSVAPFIEGLVRATGNNCYTCKWYAYLTTFGSHICHAAVRPMTEQEVQNTVKYGCDAWEPREASE